MTGFLAYLHGRELVPGHVDAVMWNENSSKCFSVRSYFRVLQGDNTTLLP